MYLVMYASDRFLFRCKTGFATVRAQEDPCQGGIDDMGAPTQNAKLLDHKGELIGQKDRRPKGSHHSKIGQFSWQIGTQSKHIEIVYGSQ